MTQPSDNLHDTHAGHADDVQDTAPAPRRLGRRRFLRWLGGSALAATALGADALLVEPRWVRVTRPVVSLAGLGQAWDGLRIALLTDLHVGRLQGLDYIDAIVRRTNALQPDIVALTGDLLNRPQDITAALGRCLAGLRAPLGLFAVLGNHDHWADAGRVTQLLSEAGFAVLSNSHRRLVRNGQGLCLAGVDDYWEARADAGRALHGADPAEPAILLCHNPDYAESLPAGSRVDLMLCGHTHGGQVKIPWGPRPCLPVQHARYAAGLAQGPHCQVYTSVGLGMVGLPVRFNCRPELALLTLQPA